MPTGIEMYNAVKLASADYDNGAEFAIHPHDAKDLRKLQPSQLQEVGYGLSLSEEISAALLDGEFGPLEKSMGITFVISFETPRLPLN